MEFGERVEGGTFCWRGRRLAQGLGIAQRRREKVGVDADQPVESQAAHGVGDLGAHVAPLRHIPGVTQASHQLRPGLSDTDRAPAELGRLVGEPVAGDRRQHEGVDSEPPFEEFRAFYGELAALGIAKGQPFDPDERMTDILTRAAEIGRAQLRVQSFADRRPDRVVWPGIQWEWAVLRPENGTFDTPAYHDGYARQKWFYQAQIESPAMFRRTPGAGSLYWLGTRDVTGTYLDGGRSYTLTVPQPVPAQLFWSITVYDARTRSEIATDQSKAALRSMFELADIDPDTANPVNLPFGPPAPEGAAARRWIQTIPGAGWFVYFRIYGPTQP